MMTIAAVVPTTPRCVMAINQADQPALNKRASQQQLRPIALPDSFISSFNRITSRSFRMGTLSAVMSTPCGEAGQAAIYPASSTLQGAHEGC